MGSLDDDEKSGSCCTWIKIAAVALLLAVSGILIWQYAPIDNVINGVLPTVNNTATNGTAGSGTGATPGASPSPPPSQREGYQFIACADPLSPGCCNGLDNGICDLRVDEILWATSHNANADFESGFLFSPNHQYKLEDSLIAGYRGINLDVCNCGGQLQLCHGICSFGTREIVDVLMAINEFLDDNPSETIILPLELNSRVDQPVDIDEVYGLMQQVPGFIEKMYIHPSMTDAWPTLGELVASNQRVIILHFGGPTCEEAGTCPPGMDYYYSYAINTQWNLANLDAVANVETSCAFTTTPGNASKTFFGLNNFVSPPVQATAQTMNAYDYVADRIEKCSTFHDGLDVNFIYVDFWSEGDLPRLVQDRNSALAASRRLDRDADRRRRQ